jgi:hypothetical protein
MYFGIHRLINTQSEKCIATCYFLNTEPLSRRCLNHEDTSKKDKPSPVLDASTARGAI